MLHYLTCAGVMQSCYSVGAHSYVVHGLERAIATQISIYLTWLVGCQNLVNDWRGAAAGVSTRQAGKQRNGVAKEQQHHAQPSASKLLLWYLLALLQATITLVKTDQYLEMWLPLYCIKHLQLCRMCTMICVETTATDQCCEATLPLSLCGIAV